MHIPRSAGILIPLFSLRTREDLRRGEILDLPPMLEFALAMGHRVIQLLPLDESGPDELSPYSALSVFAIDPMYVSAHKLHGVGPIMMRRARVAVGSGRFVPRSRSRPQKLKLLERAYRASRVGTARGKDKEFNRFVDENRYWLEDYALFRALADRYQWIAWEKWPPDIARRGASALDAARRELASQIAMYSWWQFVAYQQWMQIRAYAASNHVFLGGDVAFSPSRDSAEVWANQDLFDLERTVGAPPDAFNPKGQRWGLPMPRWDRMRAGGLKLWRDRIRRAASLYDLIRVDHVVGLYRTFNFRGDPDAPGEFTPAAEDDQRAQGEEMMRAAIEAARGSTIIAEDLGTVPPWVRRSLAAMGVAGYKVMQWERAWDEPDQPFLSPARYPELALATTGTHDTEALSIWWRKQSEDDRRKLIQALGVAERVNPHRGLDRPAQDAILEALYASPARLALMPMQDLFGWTARINRPGTVGDSNWTWRLPLSIERLRESAPIRARVAKLRTIAEQTGRF